jgi:fibronectin type 3 domain-containing protein
MSIECKSILAKNALIVLISTALFFSCSQITAPPDDIPPSTPGNFTLLGGGDGQASFRWARNTEGDFYAYEVYRAMNTPAAFELIAETYQNEFVDMFLNYDYVYYYYITAKDFAGNESAPSATYDVRPINISSPIPPTNVSAFGHNYPDQGQLEIFVRWKAPNIGDLWKYFIYRGTTPDFIGNASSLLDSTEVGIYYDRNVQVGDVYYYRVSSMDLGRKISEPSVSSSDIILASAALQSPSNRIEFRKPYNFAWKKVDNAVTYKISIGKSPMTDIIWTSDTLTETAITYTGPSFESGALYYWWVSAFSKQPYLNTDNALVDPDINSRSEIWVFFAR